MGCPMSHAQLHMGKVAAIGCIACALLGYGETPAQVHHIREGRIARNDYLTLPLCDPHHAGARPGIPSIHKAKAKLLRALGVHSEFDLLAEVLRRIP